ncbi:hypothetical protein MP638_005732 [Amoeboaphelidium occidentale]|nr:hypothetical protein MP638_005732 [Amoeboaphelidium occidentale]
MIKLTLSDDILKELKEDNLLLVMIELRSIFDGADTVFMRSLCTAGLVLPDNIRLIVGLHDINDTYGEEEGIISDLIEFYGSPAPRGRMWFADVMQIKKIYDALSSFPSSVMAIAAVGDTLQILPSGGYQVEFDEDFHDVILRMLTDEGRTKLFNMSILAKYHLNASLELSSGAFNFDEFYDLFEDFNVDIGLLFNCLLKTGIIQRKANSGEYLIAQDCINNREKSQEFLAELMIWSKLQKSELKPVVVARKRNRSNDEPNTSSVKKLNSFLESNAFPTNSENMRDFFKIVEFKESCASNIFSAATQTGKQYQCIISVHETEFLSRKFGTQSEAIEDACEAALNFYIIFDEVVHSQEKLVATQSLYAVISNGISMNNKKVKPETTKESDSSSTIQSKSAIILMNEFCQKARLPVAFLFEQGKSVSNSLIFQAKLVVNGKVWRGDNFWVKKADAKIEAASLFLQHLVNKLKRDGLLNYNSSDLE